MRLLLSIAYIGHKQKPGKSRPEKE